MGRPVTVLRVGGARILFFSSSATLVSGTFEYDLSVKLLAAGAIITSVTGSEANFANNIAGKDMWIMHSNAGTAAYGITAQSVATPGIVARSQAWPATNCGFCASVGASTGNQVNVLLRNHPLSTGDSASASTVAAGGFSRATATTLPAGAQVVAITTVSNLPTVIAFEKGSAINTSINGGICAGRRVAMGLTSLSFNDRGWQFWIDSINWCLGM